MKGWNGRDRPKRSNEDQIDDVLKKIAPRVSSTGVHVCKDCVHVHVGMNVDKAKEVCLTVHNRELRSLPNPPPVSYKHEFM